MPPEGQLSNEAITTLTQWIAEGMPWDEQRLRGHGVKTGCILVSGAITQRLPSGSFHGTGIGAFQNDHHPGIGFGHRGTGQGKSKHAAPHHPPQGCHTLSGSGQRPPPVDHWRLWTHAFWDAHTGEMLDEITDGLLGRITQLMISHDQPRLIACSLPGWSGNMHLFDLERRVPLFTWQAHKDEIFDCVETRDSSYWITASADHTIKLWESDTYREHD